MATATVFSPLLHKFCYGGTSMAASGIFSFSPRSYSPATPRMGFLSLSVRQRRPSNSFQVRSVAAPSEAVSGFDDMVVGTQRKCYMLGGKGGIGKISCAASLVVKCANNGHPTIVVSTDPAHSLSDSFAQDLTGGMLVPVEGPDAPLSALEVLYIFFHAVEMC